MSNAQVDDTTQQMREFLFAYGSDHTQLLLWVIRQLAQGRPLTPAQVDQHIAALRIAPEAAHQFLREVTERDEADHIIGAMGLSLSDSPHRLSVNGVSLSAWCALDTLYLPAMLQQTATITSPSPVSHQPIRLRVSPERVEEVSPANAVVSFVLVDPNQADMSSVQAIWGTFCHHIHFFATQDEAEQWVKGTGRSDLAILTVEEGFARAGQMWSKAFPDLFAARATGTGTGHSRAPVPCPLAAGGALDTCVPGAYEIDVLHTSSWLHAGAPRWKGGGAGMAQDRWATSSSPRHAQRFVASSGLISFANWSNWRWTRMPARS